MVAPRPEERRQRAAASCGERVDRWSKARIQLWRARERRSRTEDGIGVRGVVLGSTMERRMRAAKVLPEPGGPWRMRTGNGPPGRRAARSQARQRSQPARDGRLRHPRRVSRAPGAGEPAGGGRERVERGAWRRALVPRVVFQPVGEISTNWHSGLARLRRIWEGRRPPPRHPTRRKTARRWSWSWWLASASK